MKKRTIRTIVFLLTLLLPFNATPLFADWSDDPSNCTPICVANNAKMWPQLTETTDGYVVSWVDERRGAGMYRDLYAQKFTVGGEMLWTADGRVIAAGPEGALIGSQQNEQSLVTNNAGGAIIQWTDHFGVWGNTFISQASYDQNVQWGIPGVAIQSEDTAVQIADNAATVTRKLVRDTEGGVFSLISSGRVVSLQRLSSSGEKRSNLWKEGDYTDGAAFMSIIPSRGQNEKDAVITAFVLNGHDGIWLKKVSDPETRWPNGPDTLKTDWAKLIAPRYIIPWNKDGIDIVSDDAGGGFVVWVEDDDGIYIQKVNANGSFAWQNDGVPISTVAGWKRFTSMIPDGSGGVVVFWDNNVSFQPRQIFAQRIDANGVIQWGTGGIPLETTGENCQSPQAILSSEGNYIVVFHRGKTDLVAQKINDEGDFLWETEGRVLSTHCWLSDWEKGFDIVSDNQGGVIAVFTGWDKNIYGARVYEPRVTLSAPLMSYTLDGTSINIDWDAVPDATGYLLNFTTGPYTDTASFTAVDLGAVTNFFYDALVAGETYTIAIQAYNEIGSSNYSNIETFTSSLPVTPAPPVMTYSLDGTRITIDWDDVPGATGYTLYYAPNPFLGEQTIGSIEMGEATDFSIVLWTGASYFLAVEAYNGDRRSGYSNIELFTIDSP